MLTFFDTPWHIVSTLLVFLLGVVLSQKQHRFFKINKRTALLLYIWHLLFSVFYYSYSLDNTADAKGYYLESLNMGFKLKFGTEAVTYLTSIFSLHLGMSYGGVFVVFHLFGYVGMLALLSALQSITAQCTARVRFLVLAIILLPGVSFWSAAIGKDSLTFMASGLVCWSVLHLRRRYPAMILAVGLFLIARPHIAGILIASLAVAQVLVGQKNAVRQLLLLLVLIPVSWAMVQFGLDYVGLGQASGLRDVSSYIEQRQGYNLEGGSSLDIRSMPMMLRFFSYLYRPMLFEANGFMGLIIAVENLFLLWLLVYFGWRILQQKSRKIEGFALVFFLLYFFGTLFVLANTTANLGIAIRQKWMILPPLLMVLLAYGPVKTPLNRLGLRRSRTGATGAQPM